MPKIKHCKKRKHKYVIDPLPKPKKKKKAKAPSFFWTLRELGLSRETMDALDEAGLNDLYNLTQTSHEELVEAVGEEKAREVMRGLWSQGLRLDMGRHAMESISLESPCPACESGHDWITIWRNSDTVYYELQCRNCLQVTFEII